MSTGLGEYHHAEEEEPKGSKYTHWAIMAVIIGGIAVYVVSTGMLTPSPTPTTTTSFPRGL